MANLIGQINEELKAALKVRKLPTVSSLRLLASDIHNEEIAKGGELTDEEVSQIISKKAKRHKESIESFEKAGRDDLANQEKEELEVLQKYLPKQISDEQVGKIVNEVIAQSGAVGSSDTGKVIGQVIAMVKGQADSAKVAEMVKERLGNLLRA